MLLNDKTLLVTGAGRGIGLEIVKCALREGAHVVAHVGRAASDIGRPPLAGSIALML